jgi:tight adherence protein B
MNPLPIPSPFLGLLVGATIAAGLVVIGIGAYGETSTTQVPTTDPPVAKRAVTLDVRTLVGSALIGGIAAGVTGWWSFLVLAVVGGVLIPMMHRERVEQVAVRSRVAAVASWVETIRDLLSAASGIEEAITRSADTLPVMSPIRNEVLRLRAITSMGGLREGLRRFGEDLADPTVDYVTATLLIASERSSGVLHEQLSEAGLVAREQVAVREQIEASRSRMRTTATAIVAITVVMAVFIIGTQPSYGRWYGGMTGQVVLSVAGTVELVGLWWMARLARPEPGVRIVLDSTRSGATFTRGAA